MTLLSTDKYFLLFQHYDARKYKDNIKYALGAYFNEAAQRYQ
ncbi:hypothetical protein A1OE_1314 [Candidatus Endolissoclinum faulkneri L2]|uniref:Uncharacterized protein n=1 Tax=Candidatus Endolissoclinum faulkneri L2 TaxID=1193729 RepID=K7YPP7_9PROT|nr:hypothetical protein A1OE_1314 [Candidatus Endolissoclinum faulkneri L2]